MKKNLTIWGIFLLTLLLLGGCASQSNSSSYGELQTATKVSNKSLLASTKVSLEEVIDIFQRAYPQARITSIELGKHFRNPVYKIEGVDDTNEYDLTINAVDKKVIKQKHERLDQDDQNDLAGQDKVDLKGLLSLSEVSKIAEKELSGGKVAEFNLDQDLGVTYWEVTIKRGMAKKEVKINAQSGKIMEIEND